MLRAAAIRWVLFAVVCAAAPALCGEPDTAAVAANVTALLQKTRNNADPRVWQAVAPLLRRLEEQAPEAPRTKVLQAWYDISLHRFRSGIVKLRQAQRAGADDAIALGLLSDALVETGEYQEAVQVTQHMLDRYPGLPALSRAAHLRFLHDDLPGALALARAALQDPKADDAARAWVRLQLAEYELQSGRPRAAAALARAAQAHSPQPAKAMLARARAQQGRSAEARKLYLNLLSTEPSPEHAFSLYKLARDTGDRALQRRQAAMLEAMSRLDGPGLYRRGFAEFFADLPGREEQAVAWAWAEWEGRPDIYSAMGLAWALFRSGQFERAKAHCIVALRLNTPDPVLRYQGALILRAAGDRERSAKLRKQAVKVLPQLAGYERWLDHRKRAGARGGAA